MAPFDPYHIWLGIPPEDQPPSHYRLLAIPELESNPDVIDAGAEQRTVFLRTFQTGDQFQLAEQLLNEVSAARICLLNAEQKAEYDRQLQVEIQPAPIPPPPVTANPAVVVKADPPAISFEQPVPSGHQPRRRKQKISPFWQKPRMLAAAGGLVAVMVLLLFFFINSAGDKSNHLRKPKGPATAKREKNLEIPDKNIEKEEQAAAADREAERLAAAKAAAEKAIAETIVILKGHSEEVISVAFSPDGKQIVSGSRDATAKVWDAETGQLSLTLTGHAHIVESVAFSPDGKRIVSGSFDKAMKVWDAETGQLLHTTRHANGVASVAFSPDGKRITSGGGSYGKPGEIKVWDAETGQETLTLKGHSDRVWSVSFSPDGKRIVSGSYDNTLKVWDVETGEVVRTLKGHKVNIYSVAFSPDGKRIASGSSDQTVKVWDAETGQETLTLRGHYASVRSVAFSPDGKWIASGGDNTVRVWDAETGQETLTLIAHHAYDVSSISFSPDGKRIVCGNKDNTVNVWNVDNTAVEMRVADKPDLIVNSIGMKLAFIPAGEFQMGSPEDEPDRSGDETQHTVTITNPFYMQTTEVTQGQWTALMVTEPWKGQQHVKEGPNYAASYVSWDDAVAYCKKLSEKESKTYRLPTEAEWEYACRAGTQTVWSFGDDEKELGDYAWYIENAGNIDQKYAHQVGLKEPNAFGLYDMHGNPWEWCHDYHGGDYYKQSPEKDPTGPASGSYRVLRGGSWDDFSRYSRSAFRGRFVVYGPQHVGFRLVRELD
jgi:formylglycine-generating enzyme required for sulfatase activity